ncbi:DUF1622 domain-containing protein [Geminocystis sp. CENA526]|uniref:DUF1622 domain-containing protein n=1 Tax=Geminocystis sp. CENA526 TaxID=1355871 RepID=UPI003D6DE543
MELLHIFEQSLTSLVTIAKFILEIFSVFCVIIGFIKTLQLAFVMSRRRNPLQSFNKIRLRFGMWLVIALEFQLGADILATTVAPSFDGLIKLGLIAIIRTFLNYFLVKELEAQLELEKEEISHNE